jgi:hypothetical protein
VSSIDLPGWFNEQNLDSILAIGKDVGKIYIGTAQAIPLHYTL